MRPTLLGVVTLMFLLLFFLLTTSSGQRLGVLDLRLGSPSDLAPLPHAGLVKDIAVTLRGPALTVTYTVQSTDIAAASTSVEQRVKELPAREGRPDLAALLAALEEVHDVDPSQERARFDPDDATSAETVIAVMDVIHGPQGSPLFPKIALSGSAG
ncbi:MAG: hypothetical protein Q8P41_19715 [Pseudomonadota bacterium]|nr:hypothetical protein [Pseudomonadota bacterium]